MMVTGAFWTSQSGSTTDKPASKEETTNDPEAAEENTEVEEEVKGTQTETEEAPTMATKSKVNKMPPRPDEIELKLPYRSHTYSALNFYRERLVIEPLSTFTGEPNTFKMGFDSKGTEFFVSFKPNPVLNDPVYIHEMQSQIHGRVFAEDSATLQSFKKSAKEAGNKWFSFRHKCAFAAEFSRDLGPSSGYGESKRGKVPEYEFVSLTIGGDSYPTIIVELKSKEPIEKEDPVVNLSMPKKVFASPLKVGKPKEAIMPTTYTFQEVSALFETFLISNEINNELLSPNSREKAWKRFGEDLENQMYDEMGNELRPKKNQKT